MTNYEEITSQSGMAHFVNPTPRYEGTPGPIANRTQTLCHMYLKADGGAPSDGRKCQLCRAEFNRLQAEEANA